MLKKQKTNWFFLLIIFIFSSMIALGVKLYCTREIRKINDGIAKDIANTKIQVETTKLQRNK